MRYIGSDLRQLTPPPALGEHTDAVLSELCGLDAAELEKLRADGVIGG
jgi:crotonobetainyl-CoA:carnitine CoA-transferase CaiB-like acyl-CoA transferase